MQDGYYLVMTMQSNLKSKSRTNRQRNLKNCEYCRLSRKRCEPQSRNWDGLREKCERCEKRGQPCGPSVKAAPRRTPRLVSNRSASISPTHTPPAVVEVEMPSTMPDWWIQRGLRIDQALAFVLLTEQIVRKRLIILRKYMQDAVLSPKLISIRDLLDATCFWLLNESERIARSAIPRVLAMTREEQQSWLALGLLHIASNHQLPTLYQSQQTAPLTLDHKPGIPPEIWIALDNSCSDGASLFTCVAQMTAEPGSETSGGGDTYVRRISLLQRLQKYGICESRVRTVLRSIPLEALGITGEIENDRSDLSLAFPACHIAYLNGDLAAALDLWSHSETRNQDVDITGASLAHLVVADHDLNFLRDMCKLDPQALHNSNCDCLGLTLLGVATALDYPDCVSVLLGRGVRTESNQELLDLAVESNSNAVLKLMLESRAVQPPFTKHAEKAIINNYPKILRTLYEPLKLLEHHSVEDIAMLVRTAREHGHHDLASELRAIGQTPTAPHQALEDLEIIQQQWQNGQIYNQDDFLANFEV